ncbi:MAG: site-2 protease family protein [Candidatus Absconditicoccaceae bacterium]
MDVLNIIQLAIILAISIGLHEYAHAYISYKLGDPTPKLQGRLTPNPLKHIDPIGFIMIFLVNFGRGKPVQVNPMYYKNPWKGELIVALGGPATNLILAIIGIFIILIYSKILGLPITSIFQSNIDIINLFWIKFSIVNIALAIFNLIPIPPLDGFRIIKFYLKENSQNIERYGIFLLIFVLFFIGPFISQATQFIFNILFTIFGNIFY